MKKGSILIVIVIAMSMMNMKAQNRISVEIEPYTELKVSGRIDVELVHVDSKEMSVIAREGNPEEVSVEQSNGELKIKLRPDFSQENEVSIKLPYSSLSRIEVQAGAVVNSARDLDLEFLDLKAGSGGKIELSVRLKNLEARVTQGADIVLYGKTHDQVVHAGSAGNYSAYELACNESIVKAGTGSQVKVRAANFIDVTSNTKAYVGYIGRPKYETTKQTAGGTIAAFEDEEEAELP